MPEYDRFYLQLSSPQTRSPAHSESLRWCKLIDWVRCESVACKCDGDTCHCDSLPVMQINIIYWVRCESVVWTCNGDTCHSLPVLFGKFGLCRISSHRHLNYLRDKDNQDNRDNRENRENQDNRDDEKCSESNISIPPMPVLASQVYIFFRSSMSPALTYKESVTALKKSTCHHL